MVENDGRPPPSGDEPELFRRYHERLPRSVRRVVSAPDALVEEACSFAWQRLIERRPERGEWIFAWLRTVAVREAWGLSRVERVDLRLDELTGGGERSEGMPLHELVPDERAELSTKLEAGEALERVAALRARERRLFSLQIAGFSYRELSELSGHSVRTVDRQLRRAHERVRWSAR